MVDCHNFTHFFAVSLKVLKSSREQGVLSSGHCSRCSIVCVSVPQLHEGSPVWYPHLIKFALVRPTATGVQHYKICFLGINYIKDRLKEDNVVSHDKNSETPEKESPNRFFKRKSRSTQHILDVYLSSELEDFTIYKGRCAPFRNLAIELDTPFPSSAACERMFSSGGLILWPQRACMSDKHFEACLLTNCNKSFFWSSVKL